MKMFDTEDKGEPPSSKGPVPVQTTMNQDDLRTNVPSTERVPDGVQLPQHSTTPSIFGRLFNNIMKNKNDTSLREALEEYIVEAENGSSALDEASAHERALLSNILELRDMPVSEIMIPRADIIAIDVTTSQAELLALLSREQNSRIPVYKDTLDDVLGTIHIKDILACLAKQQEIVIEDLIRDVPIVSPAMSVLDLLLMFREMKKHMTLVIDEYGGIDGLVTVGDVIEAIVGEIDDEYDFHDAPRIAQNKDGSVSADARIDIDEFEEQFGKILAIEESDYADVDTLGGLVFTLAGRIPARGEIITHPNGMVFEVIDADPRRVNRLLIKNIPKAEDI